MKNEHWLHNTLDNLMNKENRKLLMREIKFRVWDKSNKIMYNTALIGDFPNAAPAVWASFVTDYGRKEYWCNIEPGECEVMQYTGLKDKNGKEIYEGDILKFYNDVDYIVKPGYAKVVFEDGAFCCKHFKYGTEYLGNMDIADMDITVAGNVFESRFIGGEWICKN